LKVLLLGSHLNYNLEHYAKMSLEKMGHAVVFYGYNAKLGKMATPMRMAISRSGNFRQFIQRTILTNMNKEIETLAKEFDPDLVLSIKGEAIEPKTVNWFKNELGAKTALWYPDDPRYFNGLVKYVAPAYDHVFTASEKAISLYKEINVNSIHFLPFACEPTIHKVVELSDEERKRYSADVLFIGTYNFRRAKIIAALKRSKININVYGPYWKYFTPRSTVFDGIYGPEMVKAFNAAKIVLNIHVKDDISYKANMRVFEATGSGAFLLTDKPCGLDTLFKIGEEVVCYKNEIDLVESIRHYVNTDEERLELSAKAQRKAYKEHTYEKRMAQILEIML
jgi:spore maturation protein CgeB